jgi:hypothetical protein
MMGPVVIQVVVLAPGAKVWPVTRNAVVLGVMVKVRDGQNDLVGLALLLAWLLELGVRIDKTVRKSIPRPPAAL